MSVLNLLATSLNRRDEIPNQELAKNIAQKNDSDSVAELVSLLKHKDKNIRHDSIKTLYEIGYLKPELIAEHVNAFMEQLDSKNNRMQWGAMIALGTVAAVKPKELYHHLSKLIDTAEKGSVITKDNLMQILINLCKTKDYQEDAFLLFNEQLLKSLPNQLPMYAERFLPVLTEKQKPVFLKTLSLRINDLEKETKRKRVEKIISKLSK
ncbi:hypothetical protein GCM10011508_04150 [Flavobacterium lutivivi]|nr:hypothetical protein GCM10011508_04150 [Flavobacterium lutivivi]